jgi:formylglycine-generating enzyme required for sulfatase activity
MKMQLELLGLLLLGLLLAGSVQARSPKPVAAPWSGPAPEMVTIGSGSFLLAGRRKITIGHGFAVGKTEVTFAQWDACVADGGCDYRPDDGGWGRGERPVMFVSWDDATQYTAWLSRKTGRRFRLLSEAEWEYAARAGTTTAYFWGDEVDDICQYASVLSGTEACGVLRPGPAAARKPNAWGLYDTAGGVWEWVADCWNESTDATPVDGSARMTGNCGGSWNFAPEFARSDSRSFSASSLRFDNYGFRVAVSP